MVKNGFIGAPAVLVINGFVPPTGFVFVIIGFTFVNMGFVFVIIGFGVVKLGFAFVMKGLTFGELATGVFVLKGLIGAPPAGGTAVCGVVMVKNGLSPAASAGVGAGVGVATG